MSRLVAYGSAPDLGEITSHILDKVFHEPESGDFSGSSDLRDYRVIVSGDDDRIYYKRGEVVCTTGDLVTKRFSFQSDVVECMHTRFNGRQHGSRDPEGQSETSERVLVIVFRDQIRVYSSKGSKVVSFPFHIKRAFPFQNGLVFNKCHEQQQQIQLPFDLAASTPLRTHHARSSNESTNFLTLLDPLSDPGLIVSSSINSFSPNETMVAFPTSPKHSLAALYNPAEDKINVYHARYLSTSSRGTRNKSGSYMNLRKSSNISQRSLSSATGGPGNSNGGGNGGGSGSGNGNGNVNESGSGSGSGSGNGAGSGTISDGMVGSGGPSVNSGETPNSSRILTDDILRSSSTMSYDRMASGMSDFEPNFLGGPGDIKLNKDIIFTKLNSYLFESGPSALKVFNVSYEAEEAVVICDSSRHTAQFLIYSNPGSPVSLPTFSSSYTLECLDAVAFNAKGKQHEGYVALLKDESHIVLMNPFLKLVSSPISTEKRFPPISSLDGSDDSSVVFKAFDGKHYTIDIYTEPLDELVKVLLGMFKYLANSYIYEHFWLQWCGYKSIIDDEWQRFVVTLLSMTSLGDMEITDDIVKRNEVTGLLPFVQQVRQERTTAIASKGQLGTISEDYSLDALLHMIVLSIHLIREDLRLNTLAAKKQARLDIFLTQMSSWMGWSEKWTRYYMVDSTRVDRQRKATMPQLVGTPPNLLDSLGSLFTDSIVPYVTFSQLVEEDEAIDEKIIPRTYYILRLFEVLISPQFDDADLVRMMADYGIKNSDLETYPAGIYIILKNAIMACQRGKTTKQLMDADELRLIDRKDLLQFEDPSSVESLLSSQISAENMKKSIGPKEMSQILKYVNSNEVISAWDGKAEADKFHVTRLIFSEDRRFYEVTRLLQTSKVQTAFLRVGSDVDENDKLVQQRALGARIALRTLTMPIGRSAVFLSSRRPLITEKFPIPKMNFNALILPDMVSVSLEKDSVDQYLLDWGYFHNGASAGLMVSRDFDEINGSWIVFNRPPTLNAQHAGFLLGLGLNGHLKNLEEWHIYNYLGPKHTYTSIGLLLGMAASLKGTMDTKLTKVLSVHVLALLPQGSTNLNVQLPVQTAGILGIGLLYMGSQHRRMTEMLISQIYSVLTINDNRVANEGYRLAAGIALGYVNLGKGQILKDNADTHVLDQLSSLATLIRDIQTQEELDKSCGAALMALTFMFLKTNDKEMADKLAIPQTQQLLDYIRPDMLMLRCIAHNLIMWDSVEPTKTYVEAQIPYCVSKQWNLDTLYDLDSDFLPFLNIIGGILLSISIRFASTGNLTAKATLFDYFDKLMWICKRDPKNYDERVALSGARNVRDIIILGLSIIMSGTGDLDVMRRLRYLQGITDKFVNYGNYMAIHQALGFLFLGGGQQAFRTDDNFSIAALLTSIYPVYATNNYECMTECSEVLLQAVRHFWALAVENRCLVVRDLTDKQPIKADVEIEMKDRSVLQLLSPCLLPELNQVHRIVACQHRSSKGKKYFSMTIDLDKEKEKEKLAKNMTLFAYERSKYQDLKLSFDSMVSLEESKENVSSNAERQGQTSKKGPLAGLNKLAIFDGLQDHEKELYMHEIDKEEPVTESSVLDLKLEARNMLKSDNVDKLWNLKLLFNYIDKVATEGRKARLDKRVHLRQRLEDTRKSRRHRTNRKAKTILDVEMDSSEEEEEYDSSFDDTFEAYLGRVQSSHEVDHSGNDLNYLNVKFIEGLRNELFMRNK